MEYDGYFGEKLLQKLLHRWTTDVDFPSFRACDWLYALQSVNADWFL